MKIRKLLKLSKSQKYDKILLGGKNEMDRRRNKNIKRIL